MARLAAVSWGAVPLPRGTQRALSSSARCLSDHYQTLGISRNTPASQIKEVYFALSKKFHPDRFATSAAAQQSKATARFTEISSAYAILSDPVRRREYDMNLLGPAAFAARGQSARSVYDDPSFGFYQGPIRAQQASPYRVFSDTGVVLCAVGLILVSIAVHFFRFRQAKEELTAVVEANNARALESLERAQQAGRENGIEKQLQKLRDMHATRQSAKGLAAAATAAPLPATAGSADSVLQ